MIFTLTSKGFALALPPPLLLAITILVIPPFCGGG